MVDSPLEFGQPEVDDLRNAVGRDYDIAWFDVPMNDPSAMRPGQAAGDLNSQIDGLIDGQGPPLDFLFQGLAFVICHYDEQPPIVRFGDFVDDAYVWIVQRGSGSGFAKETGLLCLVCLEVVRKELEGHHTVELEVASE